MGCVQNVWQQLRDFYAFLFTNVNFNENELVCKYIIQLINHLNIVFGFFCFLFSFRSLGVPRIRGTSTLVLY